MTRIISPSALFLLCIGALIAFLFLVDVVGPVMRATMPDLVAELSTNDHALARHGQAAADVAAAFDATGRCQWGNSAVLKAQDGRNMFVCLEKDNPQKVDIHVSNSEGGTITDLPSSQISRPAAYLKNIIERWGYKLVRSFGYEDFPQWFLDILDGAGQ
jgi:hypothetical protein